jgi:hypothetical protein
MRLLKAEKGAGAEGDGGFAFRRRPSAPARPVHARCRMNTPLSFPFAAAAPHRRNSTSFPLENASLDAP